MNSSPSQSAKVVSRADCIAKSIALEFYHNDYKVLHGFFFRFQLFTSLLISFSLSVLSFNDLCLPYDDPQTRAFPALTIIPQ
jgi:hypothetical protein